MYFSKRQIEASAYVRLGGLICRDDILQRTLDLGHLPLTHMRINLRGLGAVMTQQLLDVPKVHTRLEEMGGK